jgi:hypothetical protein
MESARFSSNTYTFQEKGKAMKTRMSLVFALAVLLSPCGLFAQPQLSTVETIKTTETVGTLSELGPDTIVVRTETNTTPMKYTSTKTTTYVDETGKPVAVETVKSGLPVTVYYTQDGNRLIANKVMIRKTTTTTTQ